MITPARKSTRSVRVTRLEKTAETERIKTYCPVCNQVISEKKYLTQHLNNCHKALVPVVKRFVNGGGETLKDYAAACIQIWFRYWRNKKEPIV